MAKKAQKEYPGVNKQYFKKAKVRNGRKQRKHASGFLAFPANQPMDIEHTRDCGNASTFTRVQISSHMHNPKSTSLPNETSIRRPRSKKATTICPIAHSEHKKYIILTKVCKKEYYSKRSAKLWGIMLYAWSELSDATEWNIPRPKRTERRI